MRGSTRIFRRRPKVDIKWRSRIKSALAWPRCVFDWGWEGETDQLVHEQPEEIVFLLWFFAEEVEDEGQRLGADVRECIERERLYRRITRQSAYTIYE